MKKLRFYILPIFILFLSGCTSIPMAAEPTACRVVTEITVSVENVPEPTLCRYTDPAKMTKALNCLRRLDPWDPAETDPEKEPGPHYRIHLRFSDGSAKHYDLVANSYLRENGGPWKQVSSEHALRFALLLAAVSSDAG